jgi:WD40 repeat protein
MLLRPLNADDIFISYTRRDASTYAAGLADELSKRGFSCFIDKLGTDPDKDLPDMLKRKIRSCAMLVVVGTEWAGTRQTIEDEISEYLATGRTSVVPIDFGETVYKSRWYNLIEGIAPERELNPNALNNGDPSPSVVSRIEKQFNYRRRDERLRRITRRAIAVLIGLLVAIAGAGGVAWHQLKRAADATAKANEETARADRQRAIAETRSLANRSETLRRQLPEELPRSLSRAVEAMKKSVSIGEHIVEADAALRDSLALLPRLRSSDEYSGAITYSTLSPDGRHFATLVTKTKLLVYESGSQKPLKEVACDCSAVALSNGLAYAAVVENRHRGVRIIDPKDPARSRLVKLGESISPEKVALSPGGRYLALSFHKGKDIDHSRVEVVDAQTGKLIKSFDDLNMVIHDIAFGPNGNLAVGGYSSLEKEGRHPGRVVIWSLSRKPPNGRTEPELTAASFSDFEVVPQDSEVRAIAPGVDNTSFATGGIVWKRITGQAKYEPVARLPLSRTERESIHIERLAFSPDGKGLSVVKQLSAHMGTASQRRLEVWDASGHRDVAEVLHTAGIASVGFKAGGQFFASTTIDTSERYARAFVRVFGSGDGAEVLGAGARAGTEDEKFIHVSPDAGYLVTVNADAVRVWDVWGKKQITVPFDRALKAAATATLSPGGTFLALSGPAKEGDGQALVIYRSEGNSYKEWKTLSEAGEVWMMSLSVTAGSSRRSHSAPAHESGRLVPDGM